MIENLNLSDDSGEDQYIDPCNVSEKVTDDFRLFFSLWAQSTDVTVHQYRSLVQGLKRYLPNVPEISRLPDSLTTLKKYVRQHLPLSRMYWRNIKLDQSKTDIRSQPEGKVHYFDMEEIVKNILKSDTLLTKMYFGPAIWMGEAPRSELYHGSDWSESICACSGEFPFYRDTAGEAMFQSDCVRMSSTFSNSGSEHLGRIRGIWKKDDTFLLQVDPILKIGSITGEIGGAMHEDEPPLPTDFCIVEDDSMWVSPDEILDRVRLSFEPLTAKEAASEQLSIYGKVTRVYVSKGKTGLEDATPYFRMIFKRWRTIGESEIQTYGRRFLQEHFVHRGSPESNPIRCLPHILFCDGFALLRTMYRSCCGFYLCMANMPLEERRKQQNWHTVTLTPFGSNFADVVSCLAKAGQRLARGTWMTLHSKKFRISSFLLAGLGDMPQQASNTGSKSQMAVNPCRCCFISKLNANNLDYDISEWARYDQFVENLRYQARQLRSQLKRSEFFTDWGLAENPSPWLPVYPALVAMKQFAIDVNHSELKGMSSRFIDVLWDAILTEHAKKIFLGILRDKHQMPLPSGWNALQDPGTHRKSYSYTELGRLSILLPFILAKFFDHSHIKASAYSKLQSGIEAISDSVLVDAFILDAYKQMKDHISTCTQTSLTLDEASRIQVLSCNQLPTATESTNLAI